MSKQEWIDFALIIIGVTIGNWVSNRIESNYYSKTTGS